MRGRIPALTRDCSAAVPGARASDPCQGRNRVGFTGGVFRSLFLCVCVSSHPAPSTLLLAWRTTSGYRGGRDDRHFRAQSTESDHNGCGESLPVRRQCAPDNSNIGCFSRAFYLGFDRSSVCSRPYRWVRNTACRPSMLRKHDTAVSQVCLFWRVEHGRRPLGHLSSYPFVSCRPTRGERRGVPGGAPHERMLNGRITFNRDALPLSIFGRFVGVCLAAYLATVVAMWLSLPYGKYLAQVTGMAVYTLIGFFGCRLFAFRSA